VEQLLGVLPLIERLALVESLVALKPDERPRRDLRERLRQLGLADARRPLDQHRTTHPRGQEHDGGHTATRDVPGVPEPLLNLLDGLEHEGCLASLSFGHWRRHFAASGPPERTCTMPHARRDSLPPTAARADAARSRPVGGVPLGTRPLRRGPGAGRLGGARQLRARRPDRADRAGPRRWAHGAHARAKADPGLLAPAAVRAAAPTARR